MSTWNRFWKPKTDLATILFTFKTRMYTFSVNSNNPRANSSSSFLTIKQNIVSLTTRRSSFFLNYKKICR